MPLKVEEKKWKQQRVQQLLERLAAVTAALSELGGFFALKNNKEQH